MSLTGFCGQFCPWACAIVDKPASAANEISQVRREIGVIACFMLSPKALATARWIRAKRRIVDAFKLINRRAIVAKTAKAGRGPVYEPPGSSATRPP